MPLAAFDIITPNNRDLQALAASLGMTGSVTEVQARQLVDCGVRDVVVMLAERGALLLCSGVSRWNRRLITAAGRERSARLAME